MGVLCMKIQRGQTCFEVFGEPVKLSDLENLKAGKYELSVNTGKPIITECNYGEYVIDEDSIQFAFSKCSLDFYVCTSDGTYQSFTLVWWFGGCVELQKGDSTEPLLVWKTLDSYPECESDAVQALSSRIEALLEVLK